MRRLAFGPRLSLQPLDRRNGPLRDGTTVDAANLEHVIGHIASLHRGVGAGLRDLGLRRLPEVDVADHRERVCRGDHLAEPGEILSDQR